MSSFADLIITNAKVYTVDQTNPQAQAVAVKGEQIIFVGPAADVASWRGPQTRVVDGQGRTLLPGFIDSHFHLLPGSIALGAAQLYDIESLAELEAALQSWRDENPDAPWVIGYGASYALPSTTEALTRFHLDAIESERPLALFSFDLHTVWANTAALKAANLLSGTDSLSGSAEVVLGADGLATGELIEPAAFDLLTAHMPEPDEVQKLHALTEGLALAASLGITSVQNMDGNAEQAMLYAALDDMGQLPLRVYIPYDVVPETSPQTMAQEAVTMRNRFNSTMVRSNCVKFFIDGVFESYTAMVFDGYPDQPDNHGDPIFEAEHFKQMIIEADHLGLQIFVHACGDQAVHWVLDSYEAAQKANGQRDSRHRVEHIELIQLDDVPRFVELGVIASMQPLHSPLQSFSEIWPTRVRRQDWDRSFAWSTLREAGACLAFGSDWPVVTLSPFAGLDAALNRQPWEPGNNAHTQTLAQAIAGYTKDAAYAEFQEDKKGQLKVGLWADMVLLSEDIFNIPPEQIGAVEAVLTVCNGRVVYEAE